MRTISIEQLHQVRALAERQLSVNEFVSIADGPIGEEERAETLSRLSWYLKRYRTPGERLAYIRRATERLARPTLIEPTALLTEAHVMKGGLRSLAGQGVRVCLMNVLRWTPTDLQTRKALLIQVIREIRTEQPTILLAPAGYFGWDTVTGLGRNGVLHAGSLDRHAVIRFLLKELQLPPQMLLVVGVDGPDQRQQRVLFVEAGRSLEIQRDKTALAERIYRFPIGDGALVLLGLVCGEFMDLWPTDRRLQVERARREHAIDVILDPAHIDVRCSQRAGVDLRRFPFERFFQDVSAARVACFLAHHHPDEQWAPDQPKSHSYSNWGIFAGSGAEEDWLPWTPPRLIRLA